MMWTDSGIDFIEGFPSTDYYDGGVGGPPTRTQPTTVLSVLVHFKQGKGFIFKKVCVAQPLLNFGAQRTSVMRGSFFFKKAGPSLRRRRRRRERALHVKLMSWRRIEKACFYTWIAQCYIAPT